MQLVCAGMGQTDRHAGGRGGLGAKRRNAGYSCGHAGRGRRLPLVSSPVFGSTYHLAGEPAGPYQYGRLTNPTWSAWEAALSELEGGDAVAFSSGIAAVAAVLLTALRPGDVLVMAAECYYATRRLATGLLTDIRGAGASCIGRRRRPSPRRRNTRVA